LIEKIGTNPKENVLQLYLSYNRQQAQVRQGNSQQRILEKCAQK